MGKKIAFGCVACACLCCIFTFLPCTPALCDISSTQIVRWCFWLSVAEWPLLPVWIMGMRCRGVGGKSSFFFFPLIFLMLSTHWLNFGPCGYFHQSHSYTDLHLLSRGGFILLFLMLRWPLAVEYSHCTFLNSCRFSRELTQMTGNLQRLLFLVKTVI